MHRNSNITDNLNSTFHNAGILDFRRLENVDNQHCYSHKNTFVCSRKEKDSLRLNPQSGGLCGARLTSPPDLFTSFYYFGARYYDPSLSGLFLSVDPMADKYPSISPYAYCAWNPVKLVDPDGKEIDDYFSYEGKYLGSDDAETRNVRIISEFIWNRLEKNNSGQINHTIGANVSYDFSEAAELMTDNAQLSVYQHYNPIKKHKVEAVPKKEIKTSYHGMITKIGCADKKTGKAIVSHLYVKLEENRKYNSSGEALCDNAYEIINSFIHERDHIRRAIGMGYYKWAEMVASKEGLQIIELSAISAQRTHDSWNGCRPGYKQGIANYEEFF